MILVNTDYISGKELEMLGLVKGVSFFPHIMSYANKNLTR